ncbi:MAG: translation initiation factor 4E [Harvfovirus sp.]|uniref:Translation initiation factor 4E n=1 Tax=Harvfovirus sp. TaxID=2487768 RepID=A0A3G5A5H0_9VIRU|nr:MAG: translation initiation factor 4E [Harvfovirus sp.]
MSKPASFSNSGSNMNKLDSKLVSIEVINKFASLPDEEERSVDHSVGEVEIAVSDVPDSKPVVPVDVVDPGDEGWKTIRNKKFQRKKMKDHLTPDDEVVEIDESVDNGTELKFKHKWKVWVHLNDSTKWDRPSFDEDFFIIDSVGSFLQFFNNFYKFNLKMYSFYIMKSLDDGSYVVPTWEDPLNRNGGTCSLRIDMIHGIELMPLLCILIFNECLIPDMTQINGISFNTKTNWALIKLWTRDKDVDITKMLPDAIINSYPSLCIKNKANTPEY